MSRQRLKSILKTADTFGPELSSLMLNTLSPLEIETLGLDITPKRRNVSFFVSPQTRLDAQNSLTEQKPAHIMNELTNATILRMGDQLNAREEERILWIVEKFGKDIRDNLCVKCLEQMDELIEAEHEKRIIEVDMMIKDLKRVAVEQRYRKLCLMKRFYVHLAEYDMEHFMRKLEQDRLKIQDDQEFETVEEATKTAHEIKLPKNFCHLLKGHDEVLYLDSLNSIWKMFSKLHEKANNLYRRRKILNAYDEIQQHNTFVYHRELPLLREFLRELEQLKVDLDLLAIPIITCKMRIRTVKKDAKKLGAQDSIQFFELKEGKSDTANAPLVLNDCTLLPYFVPPTRSLSSIIVGNKTYHSIRRMVQGPLKPKIWKWQKDSECINYDKDDENDECPRDNNV